MEQLNVLGNRLKKIGTKAEFTTSAQLLAILCYVPLN